jgi:hypothetical protein
MRRIRRRVRVLILAALLAALVVPVGFALSIESESNRRINQAGNGLVTTAAPLAMKIERTAARESARESDRHFIVAEHGRMPISDTVVLLALGTVLLGLASAMRRAE